MNFKNPFHDCADIALVQHSPKDEPNRACFTLQNLASRGEGWSLNE